MGDTLNLREKRIPGIVGPGQGCACTIRWIRLPNKGTNFFQPEGSSGIDPACREFKKLAWMDETYYNIKVRNGLEA